LQIITNTFDDLTLFRVAVAYSDAEPALFPGDAVPDYHNEEVQFDVKGGG